MSGDKLTVTEALEQAMVKTLRLQNELDITNADHIAVWLEEQLPPSCDDSIAWLACRIIDAHEAATTELVEALREIAELTKKQQLPITAQVHELAMSALHNRGEQ